MADTSPKDETVAPQAPSNEPSTTAAPATVNSSADVEQAKRDAEAQRLRANQLQNELDKVKQSQEEAQRKTLEDNQQYKDLWEKERAEKENLISEREAALRKSELEAATSNLFKDYSPAVQELARTAGLSLTDDSETSTAELKTKLDTFASKLGSPKVEANNPAPSSEPTTGREQQVRVMRMNNVPNSVKQTATAKAVSGLSAIKEMRAMNGIAEPQ